MPRAVGNHLRSLARLWDDVDDIRARVRGDHCVLDCGGKPVFHATVKTCSQNCDAILPALELTKKNLKLPEIAPLQQQLNAFYEMNKLTVPPEHVLREAWGIKAACGFVKRKGRRGEVTKDPRFHKLLLVYFPELQETIDSLAADDFDGESADEEDPGLAEDLHEEPDQEEGEEDPFVDDLLEQLLEDEGKGDGEGAPEGLEAEGDQDIFLEPEIPEDTYPSPSPDKSPANLAPEAAEATLEPEGSKLDDPVPAESVHSCARPLRRATPLPSNGSIYIDSDDEQDKRSKMQAELARLQELLHRRSLQRNLARQASKEGTLVINDSLEQVPGFNIDTVETQVLQVMPLPASVPASPPKPEPIEAPSDDHGEVEDSELAKEQPSVDQDGTHGDDLPMEVDTDKTEPKETPSSSNPGPALSTTAGIQDDPPPQVLLKRDQLKIKAQAKGKDVDGDDDAGENAGSDDKAGNDGSEAAGSRRGKGKGKGKGRGRGRGAKRGVDDVAGGDGGEGETKPEPKKRAKKSKGKGKGDDNSAPAESPTVAAPKAKAKAKSKAKAKAKSTPKPTTKKSRGKGAKRSAPDQDEGLVADAALEVPREPATPKVLQSYLPLLIMELDKQWKSSITL